MSLTEILNRLWDPVSTPVLLAFGAIAARLWQKFLTRLGRFRWSVWHTRVAVAGDHPHVGTIAVSWNGTAVNHLQMCSVELENESGQDFTTVEVKFSYDDGTEFRGEGTVYGTMQFLPWAPHYAAVLAQLNSVPFAEQSSNDRQFVLTHREYTIPVFNRGARFNMTFLVEPPGIDAPRLHVSCDHPGVRLYQRSEGRPTLWGVVQTHAAWIGLTVGAGVTIVVSLLTTRTWVVATTAFVLAAFALQTGAALVRTKRWIVKTIG
jgi:hypothetical protein